MPPTPEERAAHMARRDALADALQAALDLNAPGAIVTARSMFGGAGYYVGGRIIAAWFGETLALRLPPDAADALMQVPGTHQSSIMHRYIEVPEAWHTQPELLGPWAAQALDFGFGARAPLPPSRQKRRRRP